MSNNWKIPETEVIVELIIYGFDSNEEQAAIEEIKNQIETGLDIQGISGTRLVSVTIKKVRTRIE